MPAKADSTTTKRTKRTLTPAQRAQAAYDVAKRLNERAEKAALRLADEYNRAVAEAQATRARLEYVAANPDLPTQPSEAAQQAEKKG